MHTGTNERTEAGILARYAMGNSGSNAFHDPSARALGAFFNQSIHRTPKGRGWGLTFSYLYSWLGNIPASGQVSHRFGLGLYLLP